MEVTAIKKENQGLNNATIYWLQIRKGEHTLTINVGEKTYNKVKELEKVQELPLKEEKNGKKSPQMG